MMSAAFCLNSELPTHEPVAPAIRKGEEPVSLTIPFSEDGLKSGKHDRTPCNEESTRRRVTFK